MTQPPSRSARRPDPLSKGRIIEAAVAILDADAGDDPDHAAAGLTLRNLMARLETGSGAIYHHVATMGELRAAAADEVLRQHLDAITADAEPDAALRAVALGTFESIRAHPWVGAQLRRTSLQPAVVRIWKTIGTQLGRLGLHGADAAAAGSTLTSFILGSVGEIGASPSRRSEGGEREAHLSALAMRWLEMDDDPLVEDIAAQLREHDDLQQFRGGVDIILRGIATRPPD
ncbi:MAG TPA: TetR/AcrR family transcriptional regulator C-terminal domain-containing protein [Pseudolysinimonas sp.]|nr:TetR/AcrR family transcriptional regulator C-terminal domain-containing protein [Pseudolysinimonas sp.]